MQREGFRHQQATAATLWSQEEVRGKGVDQWGWTCVVLNRFFMTLIERKMALVLEGKALKCSGYARAWVCASVLLLCCGVCVSVFMCVRVCLCVNACDAIVRDCGCFRACKRMPTCLSQWVRALFAEWLHTTENGRSYHHIHPFGACAPDACGSLVQICVRHLHGAHSPLLCTCKEHYSTTQQEAKGSVEFVQVVR